LWFVSSGPDGGYPRTGQEQSEDIPTMTIEWARVVFLNKDGSFTAFEVVPSLRMTFAPEANPPDEVVILELRDLSDADRLRLMKCAAPMKISVDWIWGQFVLEPEQLLATITPCGGFIFIQGVFKADGFKKLDAGFQVPVLVKGPCTVTLEVSLHSPMLKIDSSAHPESA
jgi:hypothetical protein